MKKLLLLLTGMTLIFLLAACSSPEADEVLDFHNTMVEDINPKLDEFSALYLKVDTAQTPEEIINAFDEELIPLLAEVKEYFEGKGPFEYDAAKDYHALHIELYNSMYDAVVKEKEFIIALFDDNVSEEEFLTLEEEFLELDEIVGKNDKAVTDAWEDLKEEFNFIEEEE